MFRLDDDGVRVCITAPGRAESVRTDVATGTRLWATGSTPARGSGPYAVLSYAIDPAKDTGLFICVSGSEARDPPWPAWHPAPAPQWRRVAAGAWVSVPDTDDSAGEVVGAAAQSHRVRETGIARGMQDRCDDIVRHGTDEAMCESLDYYTTCRVKRAFQCMNAETLRERLADVDRSREDLRAVLRRASAAYEAAWVLPRDDGGDTAATTDGGGVDDPNVICLPKSSDYDLTA